MDKKKIIENYTNELLEKYKEYRPTTEIEQDWGCYQSSVYIKNKDKELEIMINENVFIVFYEDWHDAWNLTRNNYNNIINILDNLMSNKICIISIYSKNCCEYIKYSEKKEYKKNEILSIIKEEVSKIINPVTKKGSYDMLKEDGATVIITYWNKKKTMFKFSKKEL